MTSKKSAEVVVLDSEAAVGRAGEALDVALDIAKKLNDPAMALEVVNGWLSIAVLLSPDEDHAVGPDGDPESRTLIGFTYDQ